MRKPPVCIRCSNPVGRVPARVNLGQLNSSRVIMAHPFRVFGNSVRGRSARPGSRSGCSCQWFPCPAPPQSPWRSCPGH